jgi:hypothetical protein
LSLRLSIHRHCERKNNSHLLSSNANILTRDNFGKTAGHLAAELKFYKIAQRLHPAYQTMLVNKPSSFFKSDKYNNKVFLEHSYSFESAEPEKVTIEIAPSFVTGIKNFNS